MTEKYEVTLSYERVLTFQIDADSAHDAYERAREGFEYGDLRPDDEAISELQLEEIKAGAREIRVSRHLNYSAPKDSNGLTPWTFVAHGRGGRLGQNPDLKALLQEHFPAA
ncbi:hypothetical protein [Amycolatopsis vancoresmycina]|uniref:Uncharacterized protein n=1 Tax=Amycolatopsis vancoresmycina DSM 44592 TaxID=1292037 RepID=R1I8X5_9PSEU|nr:hypothetical protein [Amycolatopsis vancoresmycina]EOD66869.1 hypothetical protein H480_19138 [Amycolatopsis vancoresmycina DSM 44592]